MFSYDLTTTTGKMRAVIPDNNNTAYVFEDAELEAFYAIEGSSLKRGAALALETIARNEAMVLKVMRLLDIQVDGAALARELRMQAGELRTQADIEEAAEDAGFDIAEMVDGPFAYRERWIKQQQRLGL